LRKNIANSLVSTHVLVVAFEPSEGWTEGDDIKLRYSVKCGAVVPDAYVQQHLHWGGNGTPPHDTIAFVRRGSEGQRLSYAKQGRPMDTWVRVLLAKYPHPGYTQWDLYTKGAYLPAGIMKISHDENWLATLASDLEPVVW
jgi:hypothetical protein